MAATKLRPRLKIETLESREVPSATPFPTELFNTVTTPTGINPAGDSNPAGFTEVGGGVVFTANDGTNGTRLYYSARNGANPTLVNVVPNSSVAPTLFAGDAYFAGVSGTDGVELFRTSGGGTATEIKDVNTNAGASSFPQNLTAYKHPTDPTFNAMYFTADDGTNGRELFRYIPTPTASNGTITRLDLTPGNGSTVFDSMHEVNGVMYVIAKANGATGWSVYQINPTGTAITPVSGSGATPLPSGVDPIPDSFVIGGASGTDLYFAAKNTLGTDHRLYRLNTVTGAVTQIFQSIVTDTFKGPHPLAYMGGYVYFSATVSGKRQLWRSDGSTTPPTVAFDNVDGGAGNPDVQEFQTINKKVYFIATVGGNRELYVTDGLTVTAAPNITPANSHNLSNLQGFGGQLVFQGKDNSNADTLFQYDPVNQTAPTAITSGTYSFGSFSTLGESLYMSMGTPGEGLEPYYYNPKPDSPKFDPDFTLDSNFPASVDPTLHTVTLHDHITNNNTLTFTGTADAPGHTIQLYYTLHGSGNPATPFPTTTQVAADGTWTWATPVNTFTFPPDVVGGSFTNGTFDVTVTDTDLTNDSSDPSAVYSPLVTIDQTPPPAPTIDNSNVNAGPNQIDATSTNNQIHISGTGEKGSYVNLYVGSDHTNPILPPILVDPVTGLWSATTPAQPDGFLDFVADSQDAATNRSNAPQFSGTYRVSLDSTGAAPPNIDNFTPNTANAGDNITSATLITLTGTAEANATVDIYMGTTLPYTHLGSTTAGALGDWTFDVSGSPAGALTPDGTYTFWATATDAAGNPPSTYGNQPGGFPIVVDTTKPAKATITSFTPDSANPSIPGTATDGITNAASITLSGTAESGSIVTIKDSLTGTTFTPFTTLGTTWTFTVGSVGNPLAAGVHTFTANSADLAGNTLGDSDPLSVTVDNTCLPPVITGISAGSDSGALGDGITNMTTITLNGTAEPRSVVTVKDGSTVLSSTIMTDINGNWTLPNVSATAGSHTYTATAKDIANNPSGVSSSFALTVDTTRPGTPTFSGFTPDSGVAGDFLTNSKTLTLGGTAENGSTVTIREAGNVVVTSLQVPSTGVNAGKWSVTTPILSDGPHAFTAEAVDAAGNVTLTPLTLPTITVDSTAPTAPVITPQITTDSNIPGDLITNDNTLTLTGTFTASQGVVGVNVFNGATLLGAASVNTANSTWSFNTASLANGVYNFIAYATDAAPNTSSGSTPLVVTVDTVVPATPTFTGFSTDSGAQGDFLTNDNTLTLSGTMPAGETGTVVTIRETNQSGSALVGTATVAGNAWSLTTGVLPDGPHNFTMSAMDLAGNTSLITGTIPTITVDTTVLAPVITGISHDTGASTTDGYTSDPVQTISGTAEAGTTVQVYDNGNPVGTAILTGTTWTYNAGTLTEGPHSFTATATDLAPNTSVPSAPFVVHVDLTPPANPGFTDFTNDSGILGDNLTNDNTPTFNGTGEDGTVVTIMEGATTIGSDLVAGGTWSITAPALADGPHTFTVTAKDLAGNPATTPPTIPTITIDTIAPTTPTVNGFVGVSPVGFNTFGSTTSATVITLSGSSGEAGLSIDVFDGGNLLTTVTPVTTGVGGVWSYTTATLTPGLHTFTAKSTDDAGNFSPAGTALNVTVQTPLVTNTTIFEDSGARTFKASELLAAFSNSLHFNGSLKGVAISSLVGNGTWSYSTKGTTFVALPAASVSSTHALLLRDTDSLKFTPAANFTGVAGITINAWDQTGGLPGEFGNLTTTGGSTPYSSNSQTYVIGVNNTNDAPTLLTGNSTFLPSISPLNTNPAGTGVGALLIGRFQDIDAFSKPGIAIVGATGAGKWQFQLSGAGSWTDIVAPSVTKAVLLDETYLVRFLPTLGVKGIAKLTFKAWDGTSGTPGQVGVKLTTANGVSTLTATTTVNVGNASPVFLPNVSPPSPSFPSLLENPKTNTGTTVSVLLSKRVGDADNASVGLAVTGVDESFGQWQYSTGGTTWKSLTGANDLHVLLLSPVDKIRFVPNPNQSGTTSITIRAWDGTAGLHGEWADPTGNSAFSTASKVATLVVGPVNQSPVLVTTGTPMLPSLPVGAGATAGTLVSSLIGNSLTDVETATGSNGIAVTGTTGTGSWQFNKTSGAANDPGWTPVGTVKTTAALLLLPTYFVRFVPAAGSPAQLAGLTFKGWDTSFGLAAAGSVSGRPSTTDPKNGASSFSTASETAYVSVGNSVPHLTQGAAFPSLTEDPKTNAGTGIKTLLTGHFTPTPPAIKGEGQGIAITAVNNTGGTWQYALGAVFTNIPASVSPANALLLPDTAKLKFVPNPDFNGSAGTVTYKAWDRSAGVAGEFADTTTGVNAFSSETASPALTVTPVNDRPVVAVGSAIVLTPLALNDSLPVGDVVSTLVPVSVVSEPADELALTPDRGIAVTGLTGAGTWQFSSDGGSTWTDIVKPTVAKAWLLQADWKLRFKATDASTAQTASITYRAWDMSKNVGPVTANAGLATDLSFSTGSLTASVSIGNTAPTI
ncbi:Ig-like domain-containing protein [Zavarzinella formosa]|uniref:Ig-like domain-containing protein n=1 Tax=Zavarzinella formosa TaxID=360055 RepID=UPI0002FC0379|nr:Ig-like domain-containing protein [Zavarzinella formosa]